MRMVEKAIEIATKAHAGQLDKCGEPYIFHPLRVMMCLQGSIRRTIAVLHDVLEDTSVTKDDLSKEFPDYVVDAVDALTKRTGEAYSAYLSRIKENAYAIEVKIVDIKDNASPSRLYKLDPDTISRLTTKYSGALKFLENY